MYVIYDLYMLPEENYRKRDKINFFIIWIKIAFVSRS